MDMTGNNAVVKSWEKEIDDITKAIEEWSGVVIETWSYLKKTSKKEWMD